MNRKIKDTVMGLLVIVIVSALVFFVYNYQKNKTHRDLAKRIAELSPRGGPPEGIDGLIAAIRLYEDQIELNVKTAAQTGAYWNMLGIRYAGRGMHRSALDAYERAIYYNTEDPALYYRAGESASAAAASIVGFSVTADSEKEHFLNLAESSFLRAIQLDAAYARPRLSLGVLYVFDLNRHADAVPHLERYLQLVSTNMAAMFVLAQAYYMTGDYYKAIELYDRIISRSKDQQVREQAQNNKEQIRDLM